MSNHSIPLSELDRFGGVFDVFGETGNVDDNAVSITSATGNEPTSLSAASSTASSATVAPAVSEVASTDAPIAFTPPAPTVTTTPHATSAATVTVTPETEKVSDETAEQAPAREPNGWLWLAAGVTAGVTAFTVVSGGNPLLPSAGNVQAITDPAAAVSATLDDAKLWYTEHGTFTGFNGIEGTDVAAGGPIIIVTAGSGANCTFAGIAPQHDTVIRTDPTGGRCLPERLASLRVDLANL